MQGRRVLRTRNSRRSIRIKAARVQRLVRPPLEYHHRRPTAPMTCQPSACFHRNSESTSKRMPVLVVSRHQLRIRSTPLSDIKHLVDSSAARVTFILMLLDSQPSGLCCHIYAVLTSKSVGATHRLRVLPGSPPRFAIQRALQIPRTPIRRSGQL